MPQQLGEKSERGYMYDCNDMIAIDDSGFRPKGLVKDIVQQMTKVVLDGPKQDNVKCKRAREFAEAHDWDCVTLEWIQLFEQAVQVREKSTVTLTEEV